MLKEKINLGIRYLRIINFLVKEKVTGLYDNLLLVFNIIPSSLRFNKNSSKKRIIFVGQEINFRTIKNIKWLKTANLFDITILLHKSSKVIDLKETYYDKLILYRNTTHLERLIKAAENIDLIVAFSSKPSYAEVAIKYSKVPTIFDAYDCMVMYNGKTSALKWLQKELIGEEFCFRNASAILARSPENRLSLKAYGISKRSSLFFADYCDNDNFQNNPLQIKKSDSEISVVYSGGIHGRHMKNKMSQGLTDFFDMIENFENQKIHFHVYPNPFQKKEDYYDYIETANKLNYFSVHTSVSQYDLTKELSTYNFGALPHFRTTNSKITDDKLERATSFKFYNYLEAGIPILVSSEMKYMAWLIRRYGLGIVFDKKDFPNMRNLILTYDYSQLKNNVIKMRELLSMKGNLSRLITFFNKVSEKKYKYHE